MPRRRPGALRARRFRPPPAGVPPWVDRIDRLSPRTVSAVHRAECLHAESPGLLDPDLHAGHRQQTPYTDRLVSPGTTRDALASLRRFLSAPGRYLYMRRNYCSCTRCDLECDPAVARDVLDGILPLLPRYARRDLEHLLAELDRELLRRTLPDVFAHREPWRRGAWWHERLYDTSDLM
ncbi:hypothetical protein [Streptomyces sp. NPDC058751]|uniref:hypothetical protein n=1 Tax=Streptomyces sp. NPDC058751 TaxID=3346623 RepID=UPI0036D06BD2